MEGTGKQEVVMVMLEKTKWQRLTSRKLQTTKRKEEVSTLDAVTSSWGITGALFEHTSVTLNYWQLMLRARYEIICGWVTQRTIGYMRLCWPQVHWSWLGYTTKLVSVAALVWGVKHSRPLGSAGKVGMWTNLSPWQISCLFLPSNDTQAAFLASRDSIIWNKTANDPEEWQKEQCLSICYSFQCVTEPNIGLWQIYRYRPLRADIKQLWFKEHNAEKEALGDL